MSCEESKWTCEYCTYENWPSSLKCTMCRGSRPYIGENIYRLGGESPGPPEILVAASGPSDADKWECPQCTYHNWSRSKRCTECRTSSKLKDSNVTFSLQEQFNSLRITDSQQQPQPQPQQPPQPCSQSKWTCPTCTYENWPKTAKCTMCGTNNNQVGLRGGGSGGSSQGVAQPLASPDRDPSPGNAAYINSSTINEEQLPLKRAGPRRLTSGSSMVPENNADYERRVRRLRQRMREADWSWLNACLAVVEGDPGPVQAYLSSGGNPARQLTATEVTLLNRPSAFDAGHTLVHLAIRFHREDMLATLLSQIEGSSNSGIKRVPSYVAPDLAADIRRHVASTVRQRMGNFPCSYVTELTTFALPAEVEDLPAPIQEQLLDELLDKDAQQQLESEPAVVNWSLEVTERLGSRLHALWNRSAGDCLLDSAMQATWGVFDRDNTLRRALSDSLHNCGHVFYPRWKESEATQAQLMEFSLEECQWEEDWAGLLSLASQPGSSLEQLHVFALAHILRRPIIVYGVKYVKSFRGEDIGYARFEGVYLPLLWEASFCVRSPIALGYTRGHFSALVSMEPYSRLEPGTTLGEANQLPTDELQVTFLPLMDRDRKILPVHFLTRDEAGREETILRQWLDVCVTEGGILVSQQRLHKRPLLVAQMIEEWLNHYRRLVQTTNAPFVRPLPVQDYSSDGGDTDDE